MARPPSERPKPRFHLSANRTGVAKSLHIVTDGARLRTVIEATSEEAARRWKEVLRADPCAYCGGPAGTIDHVTPRAMGGSTCSIRNWIGACPACNGRRGARRLLFFLADHPDPAADAREERIRTERRRHQKARQDIGAEIRAAIDGVTDKNERRRIAARIIRLNAPRRRADDMSWKRMRKRLHRELVGQGHAALDDPTARQSRSNTVFGTLNELQTPC